MVGVAEKKSCWVGSDGDGGDSCGGVDGVGGDAGGLGCGRRNGGSGDNCGGGGGFKSEEICDQFFVYCGALLAFGFGNSSVCSIYKPLYISFFQNFTTVNIELVGM